MYVRVLLADMRACADAALRAGLSGTSVEQVLLWHDDASPMSCPICLDDYRAPKITKCGHIFWCAVCLLSLCSCVMLLRLTRWMPHMN